VARITAAGHKVIFQPEGSYIQTSTGQRVPLELANGVYVMRAGAPGSQRPGFGRLPDRA
jgi:hypothetical protein